MQKIPINTTVTPPAITKGVIEIPVNLKWNKGQMHISCQIEGKEAEEANKRTMTVTAASTRVPTTYQMNAQQKLPSQYETQGERQLPTLDPIRPNAQLTSQPKTSTAPKRALTLQKKNMLLKESYLDSLSVLHDRDEDCRYDNFTIINNTPVSSELTSNNKWFYIYMKVLMKSWSSLSKK